MSLVARIRAAVAAKMGTVPCPTCGRSGPGDLSFEEAAAATGLSHSTIRRFLQGRAINSDHLDKLAEWVEPPPEVERPR